LGSRDVDEDAGGGVDNVEELFSGVSALLWLSSAAPRESRSRQGRAGRSNLHDGGAVVGDGLLAILVHHEQVAAVGAQRGLYRGLDGQAGIDVGDDLALALGSVGPWRRASVARGSSSLASSGGRPRGRWGSSLTFLEDNDGGRLPAERHDGRWWCVLLP